MAVPRELAPAPTWRNDGQHAAIRREHADAKYKSAFFAKRDPAISTDGEAACHGDERGAHGGGRFAAGFQHTLLHISVLVCTEYVRTRMKYYTSFTIYHRRTYATVTFFKQWV